MTYESNKIQEKLELARHMYAEQLGDKVAAIQIGWADFRIKAWNFASMQVLHRMVHSLAGSGQTYGFTLVGGAAHALELVLKECLDTNAAPSLAQQQRIGTALAELERATEIDVASVHRPAFSVPHVLPSPSTVSNGLIILVDYDVEGARDLATQLSHFGYTVEMCTSLADVANVLESPLTACIIDLQFFTSFLANTPFIETIQQSQESPVPLIFTSARTDLSARLQAVRAGGQAYFPKPLDVAALVDMLDHLMSHWTEEPIQVLVVEDMPQLAATYTMILEEAGIVTHIVTNPLEVMQPLIEFQPDLVLMDVYMPGCTGPELAAVIRQQEAFVSLPIVFLSGETNRDTQLAALQEGADDFLTKPIAPAHLIAAINSRVQRARAQRAHIVRDGLTGLLNHTAIGTQLEISVARARRQHTPLAFVMLDIDHFKRVNDTYGHLTGDRVLKSLARLLQQSLRKTDILGRYGGEEFAIILPDTDGQTAEYVLNAIRASVSQVSYQAGQETFSITISAGIASFWPLNQDTAWLSARADAALYKAKHSGRNQVALDQTYMSDAQPRQFEAFSPTQAPRSNTLTIPPRDEPLHATQAARILVMDAQFEPHHYLWNWLSYSGHTLEYAETWDRVHNQLQGSFADVLMIEVGLWRTYAAELQVFSERTALAIVLVANSEDELAAIKALRYGVDDYIRRPFRLQDLRAVLERTLARLALKRRLATASPL